MAHQEKRRKKKGLIFALDAALAVTVVVIMVINSSYYFSVASKSSLSHLQLLKTGESIVTLLDYTGDLANVVLNDTQNPPASNSMDITPDLLNISAYLPPNYEMWISISDLKETSLVAYKSFFPLIAPAICFDAANAPTFFAVQGLTFQQDTTALLQFNITLLSGTASFDVNVCKGCTLATYGTSQKQTVSMKAEKSGVYTTPSPFSFQKGSSNVVVFKNTDTATLAQMCVYWFRALGAEEYARSTNETMYLTNTFPHDRFITSGERIFSVRKMSPQNGESPFQGAHISRYRIWLKGGS